MDSETSREDGVNRIPKKRVPIPKFQIAIVLLIQFAEPITALVIYPFVVQFVRDTGITGGDETKTGFYAGMLESSFFFAESATVFTFGRLSDIYGRRPIILLGPFGLSVAMLGFGLSKTFWALLVRTFTLFLTSTLIEVRQFFRCIQGAFNGNIGNFLSKFRDYPLPKLETKIGDPTNIADIISTTSLAWAVAGTIAPLIGGLLSNPASKWPDTLGKMDILREHPYLLPCAVSASVALLAFAIAFVGLKETLPSIIARRRKRAGLPEETDPLLTTEPPQSHDSPVPMRNLLVRPVLIALTNHGLLTGCHMANEALVPLFFATPISFGGLGLKPNDIGLILGTLGICNAFVQAFFGGRVIRYFGARPVFTAGFCALVMQFAMYPLTGFLVRRAGQVDGIVRVALAFQLSGIAVLYFAYTSSQLCVMDAAPNRASLGSVNGLAHTVGTTMRGFAPSFSSSLFAISAAHRQIAGGNLVYIVLVVMALGAVRVSLLLPRHLRSEAK
ncbi:MFS domain-containing protein [Mycena venus]|uniref:MFS domain-containing protein n=1 Tax=Mycena venus TaxID=2733690 RepID=A0A8H6WX18_9AGAR|nr:MFS domain-containing protein [Mycena venus]